MNVFPYQYILFSDIISNGCSIFHYMNMPFFTPSSLYIQSPEYSNFFYSFFKCCNLRNTVLQTQLQKQLNVYIYSKLLPSELIGKLVISSSVLTELAPVAIFLIMEKSKIHKLLSHLQHRKIQHNAAERHPERVIMHSQTPSGS